MDLMSDEKFLNIGSDGYVSAEDVLYLRQLILGDGVIEEQEMHHLLALAERAPDGDVAWPEFFGEVIADFYLQQEMGRDYITERNFTELRHQVTRYSETVTPLVLSMLIKLVQKSTASPPSMSTFIVDQIRRIITERSEDPVISENDSYLIRNFLYARGGDGNVSITRDEAALLFDLNDLTICSANHPSWSDLFVKAIANHVMGHIGYVAPSREAALAQWEWVQDQNVNVAGFFQRMVSGGLDALRSVYLPKSEEDAEEESMTTYDELIRNREAAAREAATIDDDETQWLSERIGRDGVLDDNERAVLAYMRSLDAVLPEPLQGLLDRAA